MSTFTITTIESSYALFDKFNSYQSCQNAFTFEAFECILENEEELAISCGDNDGTINFDPVAINCNYTQYDNYEVFLDDYYTSFDRNEYVEDEDDEEILDTGRILDDLRHRTWAIELGDGSILFQTF